MTLLIADTFTDALQKLSNQEQKAVKQTAFDMQLDPSAPGLRYHRLERVRDDRFWSVSVNMDIRMIVHREAGNTLLAYVDHHDGAYRWAQNRRIEVHPKTGAAQIVEVQARVEDAVVSPQATAPQLPPVFMSYSDDALLETGLPLSNLDVIRAATEETLLGLLEGLPAEASEGLLDLLYGKAPPKPEPTITDAPRADDPFQHPDAQRRFRVLANREELERALDYPWEKWTVFLHPSQRKIVEKRFNGPARVTGTAGTGKTIVALHRAVWLAKQYPTSNVLLTTFSKTLARSLAVKLGRLVGRQESLAQRIIIRAMDDALLDATRGVMAEPNLASESDVSVAVRDAMKAQGYDKHRDAFVVGEFNDVVDAWQLWSLDAYKAVTRLGRRTPMSPRQREALWPIFEQARSALAVQGLKTQAQLYHEVSRETEQRYDFVIVDEAQDITVPQLRFLTKIATDGPKDALFFAGDLGQRIFQVPFSWVSLGVEIRGRSHRLKVNYRTSHQIRQHADKLLSDEIEDADGLRERRTGTVSVFNGPAPQIELFDDAIAEQAAVVTWVESRLDAGLSPEEIGIFVRSRDQLPRALAATQDIGEPITLLTDSEVGAEPTISVGTMHLAKGLEFRAVVVMACDDEVIPLQSRLERLGDLGDLDEVYASERHLLYVACTRAREHLWVSGVDPESEFLADLC